MTIEVILTQGKVLVDINTPTPCAATLEPAEAINLAMKLLSAAMDASEGDALGGKLP
ncbi:hypothetical protein K7957_10230 [Sphingomonas yunnanensis]|uniref:hypothetical protein n=1 Tax=Sphingomonas yunnanensis TaxID=310400 RepID=UPI001CA651FE|nr:hypothetical protein [Sphingomonas yunnanensis]MBY9063307.1 hypothetical protein [Sphingomonas yunnanensis]